MKPAEDSMSKLRVHNFAISLDGYGAGPRQGLEHGLGVGGEELHGWYVGTRAFREMRGQTGGTTGPDNDFAKRFGERIGAYIMGRNMFGPVRGPWPDDRWRALCGDGPAGARLCVHRACGDAGRDARRTREKSLSPWRR